MNLLKTSRVLLASLPRTEDTATPIQTEPCAQVARLYLDVTAASGGGGLQVVVRGYDKVSGRSVELTTGGGLVTAVGTYAYEVNNFQSDGVLGYVMDSAARSLPYQFDAIVKHSDGSQYTYSLSIELVG